MFRAANDGFKKWTGRIWALTAIVLVLLALYPIGMTCIRAALICGCIGLWLASIALVWRVKMARLLLVILPLAILVFCSLPGRQIDAHMLSTGYARSLSAYEGTRYVWGGENKVGIDCSGLVRKGFIWATLRLGARTLNPSLIREAAAIWWRDCSARTLGEGYNGRTKPVLKAQNLHELDPSLVRLGDLAIVGSGTHVMAYVGDGMWIEADPAMGRVVRELAATSGTGWFGMPATVVRWRLLDS